MQRRTRPRPLIHRRLPSAGPRLPRLVRGDGRLPRLRRAARRCRGLVNRQPAAVRVRAHRGRRPGGVRQGAGPTTAAATGRRRAGRDRHRPAVIRMAHAGRADRRHRSWPSASPSAPLRSSRRSSPPPARQSAAPPRAPPAGMPTSALGVGPVLLGLVANAAGIPVALAAAAGFAALGTAWSWHLHQAATGRPTGNRVRVSQGGSATICSRGTDGGGPVRHPNGKVNTFRWWDGQAWTVGWAPTRRRPTPVSTTGSVALWDQRADGSLAVGFRSLETVQRTRPQVAPPAGRRAQVRSGRVAIGRRRARR